VDTAELQVETGSRLVTDVTGEVRRFCRGRGDGLLTVFVPHATAGLALIETGSGTEADLAAAVDRLLPPAEPYRHRHGSPGHGRDHVLPALVAPSLTIPVLDGEPTLGSWQSVVVVDTNRDNRVRTVRLALLGD
jgi:secondary thiamine-phosphate synthase enzyme